MKTFSDVKVWGPKPDCINEVAWARRGWVVSGRNEVGCGGCGERVLVRLDNGDFDGGDSRPREGGDCEDRWWGEEAEERLIEKYESLIVEGHDKECLWRKSGSKGGICNSLSSSNMLTLVDDIYRITFSDQDAWQPGLVQRYSSLITLSDILPEEVTTPTVIEDKDRDAFDLEKLTTWFTSIWKQYLDSQQSSQAKENISSTLTTQTPKTVPTTKINKVVLTMALCGWEGQDVSDVKIAYCPKCFARVGLWMYKASSLNEDGLILDPVTLHRQHCPWQNSLSQSGLGRFAGLAGWEILNEIICSNINRAQRQRGLSRVGDDEDESVYGDGPRPSREEVEDEDRVRESKLKRLRRALSVRKMARTPDGSSR